MFKAIVTGDVGSLLNEVLDRSLNLRDPPSELYDALEVGPLATEEEIKRSWKRLARSHHPDKCDSDGSRFKHVQRAYEVLRDPFLRMAYDTGGEERLEKAREMESERLRTFEPMDREVVIHVSLTSFWKGWRNEMSIRRIVSCQACLLEHRRRTNMCKRCTFMPRPLKQLTCPDNRCGGKTEISCDECKGTGTEEVEEKIIVEIPPMCPFYHKSVVEGKSDCVAGGTPGNLILILTPVEDGGWSVSEKGIPTAVVSVDLATSLVGGNMFLPRPCGAIQKIWVDRPVVSGETVLVPQHACLSPCKTLAYTLVVQWPTTLLPENTRLSVPSREEGLEVLSSLKTLF